MNLLSNAVKFTDPDGEIRLDASVDDGSALILVIADTGIGMDQAELDIAIAPFGQVDSSLDRKYEGTGLGLPLTRELVELHKGTLDIESRKGEGTKVTIRFPSDRTVHGEPS